VAKLTANDEVVHPVAAAAQRGAVRARADGPDLSDQDPGTGTPGVTEVDDEEPDHDNSGPAGGLCVFEVVVVLCENHGDDEVRESHADGADSEHGLAASAVDVKHGRDWRVLVLRCVER
jgi:hypothetical protein